MIQDNTAKWQKKKLTNFASNNAMPVGHIYQSLSKNVPVGSLPLFGGTYDRSLYADLWSWANENGLVISESEWQAMATAQDGSCAKFSDGNGSTTFRVPALKCWVKGANGVEEVGSYLEAGLPNITGQTLARTVGDDNTLFSIAPDLTNGAFDATEYNKVFSSNMAGSIKASGQILKFNASRSNAIYGNSDTVQPPSIVGMWCIVAYGTVTNVGNADVANVMQAIEQVQNGLGKVDDISDYIVESYRNGTEWYEVYKSGKVIVGGTASANASKVTFSKVMPNTNYTVLFAFENWVGTQTPRIDYISASNKTKTGFTFTDTAAIRVWRAEWRGA